MCPGINTFTFWRFTSASQTRSADELGRSWTEAGGGGQSRTADVDSKGFKRTAHAIMLKINEINDFEANELQVVKSFVM